MSDKISLRSNFLYNFLNRIVLILIPLITTPYVTRVLGSSELGLFQYSNTIASYFVMLGTMGLSMHGSRVIANALTKQDEVEREYSTLRFIQIISAGIFSVLYLIYIIHWNHSINVSMATIQVLYVVSAVFDVTWFFSGIERFRLISIRNVVINLASTVLIFLLVKGVEDLATFALIKVSAVFLGQASLTITSAKFFHIRKIDISRVKVHYVQMLILFLPVAVESIFQSMDRVMLGALASYAAVGLYYSSRMVTDIPQCLVTSINTIMYPRIVSLNSRGERDQAQGLFGQAFYVINILCIALCFGIAAVSGNFVKIFFGPDYSSCATYIPLLAPYIFLAAWNGTVRYQYLLPNKLDKIYIRAVFVGVVVNLLVNFVLIPRYGVQGAIIATVSAEFVSAILQTYPVRKEVMAWKHICEIIPALLVGIIMFVSIRVYEGFFEDYTILQLFAKIAIGGCIFCILMLGYICIFDKRRIAEMKHLLGK